MPALSTIIGQASRGADLYFVFRFLRLLTMKYEKTDAYKLGIIDKKGKPLKRSSDLETVKEKSSYTMLHRLVWKIRGLIEKVPLLGKSILLNYAAALFLLKEQNNTRVWTDENYMKRKLMEFLETDWESDAKLLKEEMDNMNRKTFGTFLTETKLEESQELQAMMALDDAGIEAVINRKGQIVINKKDLKNAQKALKKSFRKGGAPELKTEEVEIKEENKYEMFDDKPAQELDKEMKKAMKMKSYEVARAHIGDFLIKLDKKYPKSGVLDTEPRSIVTDMLNKKFRTKHDLHYADSSDELKSMKRSNTWNAFQENYRLNEVNLAKVTDDSLRKRMKQLRTGGKTDMPSIQFGIKQISKEMKKRGIKEEVELDEGGHTDVISAKNQVKVAKSALQKMETELNKLSDESALPSWWTNKVAIAVDKLDGMADYLDTQVERKMTDAEMAKREKIVKSFKKKKDDFKDRYGDDAEDVMYATATKMAMKQEQPTTSTAGIAGLDIGLTKKKKEKDVEKAKMLRRQYLQGDKMSESIQRATFAGKDVFIVDSETFYNCRMGKKQYARYEKYVGDGMVGQAIREYGLKYPRRPIILQNGEAGPMLYLKYGRN